MNGDARHAVPHAQLDAGEQVPVERVHAAGPEQADQVQRAAGLPQLGAQLDQRRQLVELPALDALGDAHEVLGHHPAGAEVQVADLAVAHLAFGEPHGEAAGVEQGAREAIPRAGARPAWGQLDRVALALRADSPSRPAPPGPPGAGRCPFDMGLRVFYNAGL